MLTCKLYRPRSGISMGLSALLGSVLLILFLHCWHGVCDPGAMGV